MIEDDLPTLRCPLGHGLFMMTVDCPLWICPNCGAYLVPFGDDEVGCLRFAEPGRDRDFAKR